MYDLTAPLAQQRGGMFDEQLRGSTAPARVGRREVHADIALRDHPEQGVGQGMKPDIGIAMAD